MIDQKTKDLLLHRYHVENLTLCNLVSLAYEEGYKQAEKDIIGDVLEDEFETEPDSEVTTCRVCKTEYKAFSCPECGYDNG